MIEDTYIPVVGDRLRIQGKMIRRTDMIVGYINYVYCGPGLPLTIITNGMNVKTHIQGVRISSYSDGKWLIDFFPNQEPDRSKWSEDREVSVKVLDSPVRELYKHSLPCVGCGEKGTACFECGLIKDHRFSSFPVPEFRKGMSGDSTRLYVELPKLIENYNKIPPDQSYLRGQLIKENLTYLSTGASEISGKYIYKKFRPGRREFMGVTPELLDYDRFK
jgi:hypothetical protein